MPSKVELTKVLDMSDCGGSEREAVTLQAHWPHLGSVITLGPNGRKCDICRREMALVETAHFMNARSIATHWQTSYTLGGPKQVLKELEFSRRFCANCCPHCRAGLPAELPVAE